MESGLAIASYTLVHEQRLINRKDRIEPGTKKYDLKQLQ